MATYANTSKSSSDVYVNTEEPSGDKILMETGDKLLLETGFDILLNGGIHITYTNTPKP